MKPRKVPEKLKEKFECIKPIRGFEDYFVTKDKKIVSYKHERIKILSTWESNHSRRVVDLYKDGKANRRSVDKLWFDVWGDFKGYPSRIEQNMLEDYEDNPEVLKWIKENISPLVNRRDS